jgi:hypothetical protein
MPLRVESSFTKLSQFGASLVEFGHTVSSVDSVQYHLVILIRTELVHRFVGGYLFRSFPFHSSSRVQNVYGAIELFSDCFSYGFEFPK